MKKFDFFTILTFQLFVDSPKLCDIYKQCTM